MHNSIRGGGKLLSCLTVPLPHSTFFNNVHEEHAPRSSKMTHPTCTLAARNPLQSAPLVPPPLCSYILWGAYITYGHPPNIYACHTYSQVLRLRHFQQKSGSKGSLIFHCSSPMTHLTCCFSSKCTCHSAKQHSIPCYFHHRVWPSSHFTISTTQNVIK